MAPWIHFPPSFIPSGSVSPPVVFPMDAVMQAVPMLAMVRLAAVLQLGRAVRMRIGPLAVAAAFGFAALDVPGAVLGSQLEHGWVANLALAASGHMTAVRRTAMGVMFDVVVMTCSRHVMSP